MVQSATLGNFRKCVDVLLEPLAIAARIAGPAAAASFTVAAREQDREDLNLSIDFACFVNRPEILRRLFAVANFPQVRLYMHVSPRAQ